MPTYKGHTSQKFKHFLRNNRLYSSPFKDIDLSNSRYQNASNLSLMINMTLYSFALV